MLYATQVSMRAPILNTTDGGCQGPSSSGAILGPDEPDESLETVTLRGTQRHGAGTLMQLRRNLLTPARSRCIIARLPEKPPSRAKSPFTTG